MEDFNLNYDLVCGSSSPPPLPVANYVAYKVANKVVHISGQLPWNKNEVKQGKAGLSVTTGEAILAARTCAYHLIYHLREACSHDLNIVQECLSVTGYVNCVSDFADISRVIDGASNFMIEVFGKAGSHTRVAVGVSSLPRGSIVEIEAKFLLK